MTLSSWPRSPRLGGAVLLPASLLAATHGLITLPELAVTEPLVLSCLIGSILLGIGFVLVERRAVDPLLPPLGAGLALLVRNRRVTTSDTTVLH